MMNRILRLLGRLPLAWLHRLGAALGWLVYWASPTYAKRLRENLFASGVCTDDAQCRALLRQAIAETGKGAAELMAVWFGPDDVVARLVVESEGWDVVDAARARGKGIIFLTPHLGCFEMAGLYVGEHVPLTVLYRPPRQRWLEPYMAAGRSRSRSRLAPTTLKGVRMLYKALSRGEAVGVLPDQAPGEGEGAWADFFGRPAYTMTLVRRLQAASGAAVIMTFAQRLPQSRGYRMHAQALPTEHFDEAVLNRAVEEQVRRCPAQYLWGYNRYKVPAGADAPPAKADDERRKAEG
jgi:Kdo2-lipid IVA lauroyltransferase/acyltransferase